LDAGIVGDAAIAQVDRKALKVHAVGVGVLAQRDDSVRLQQI
jgi:hypothetical protein